jgi:hypothetical protein
MAPQFVQLARPSGVQDHRCPEKDLCNGAPYAIAGVFAAWLCDGAMVWLVLITWRCVPMVPALCGPTSRFQPAWARRGEARRSAAQ